MTDTPTRADLIERLRSVDVSWSEVGEWCAEAAAALTADAERIAALEGEVERLRSFIKSIDEEWIAFDAADADEWNDGYEDALGDMAKRARAALKGTDHDPAQIEGQEA